MNDKRGKLLPNFANGNAISNGNNKQKQQHFDSNKVNNRGGKAAPNVTKNSGGNNSGKVKQTARSNSQPAQNHGGNTDKEADMLNFYACKRIDPSCVKLIKKATQVAIFDYDCHEKKWNSKDILGPLFLYERDGAPKHGLAIANRKSLDNFNLLLRPDLQVQVESPNILIRENDEIRCIWFYCSTECEQIAAYINKKLENAQAAADRNAGGTPSSPQKMSNTGNQTGTNLLDMLFGKVQISSVMETSNVEVTLPINANAGRVTAVVNESTISTTTTAPTLQALFGIPSQVPRQRQNSDESSQRSTKALSVSDVDEGSGKRQKRKEDSLGAELRARLGIANKKDDSADWRPEWAGAENDNASDLDNIGDKLLPSLSSADATQNYVDSIGDFVAQPQLRLEDCFSASAQLFKHDSITGRTKTGINENGSMCGSAAELRRMVLNKEQMAQAFMYLLETDPEFTERLHNAYLSSVERNK